MNARRLASYGHRTAVSAAVPAVRVALEALAAMDSPHQVAPTEPFQAG